MPLIITSNHSIISVVNENRILRNSLSIPANPPRMPDITVTAAMQGGVLPYKAVFEWSATLEFKSSRARNGGKRNTRHPDIARQIGPNPSWRIPFTKISGGLLTVQVVMRTAIRTERAGRTWDIVGSRLEPGDIRAFANSIGANRVAFRKLMSHESTLRQFLAPNYWPLYSEDGKGGVGLCQLTDPAPTDEQTWNWRVNVRGGWAVYLAKEREARGYPGKMQQRASFRELVATWNRRARPGLPALPVDVPAFTADQLMRETLRLYNGGHEYRLRRQANGVLAVSLNANGTRGTAEWEVIPVAERTGSGDHNYVENVLMEQDY